MQDQDQRIDVKENILATLDPKILNFLLKDKTTRRNIIWATDDYAHLGDQYASDQQMTVKSITGKNGNIIRPRVEKSKDEQKRVLGSFQVITDTPLFEALEKNYKLSPLNSYQKELIENIFGRTIE